MTDYYRRTTCRACGHKHLTQVLDLGEMPPANAFVRPDEADGEVSYPLTLAFCESCSLLQVPDVVAPEILFKDYKYVTGSAAPMTDHFRRYAETAVLPLVAKDDLVVDVGGNDGTLLSFVKDHCGKVLNVDPAADMSRCGGHSIAKLFSSDEAKRIAAVFGHAKVVTANNVLAHTDDPFDFVRGVRHLLADDGTFIFEVQWAKSLVGDASFDHVYHEHLSYFSLHALDRMLENAGFELVDAQIVPTQGQSLRVKAIKDRPESIYGMSEGAYNIYRAETDAGLDTEDPYLAFAGRVEAKRGLIRDLLFDLKDGGARIMGYGAPAKGSTLLNYCGIDDETLDYVVDRTKQKQGLLVPGAHVPVVSPDRLLYDAPDYALLMSWNYRDHILEKEKVLRSRGTKFIVPGREVVVV
jgi:hypothetical protein